MPLLGKIDSLSRTPDHGLVARLHNGPEIWFGGPSNLAGKWRAAAVVLAQLSTRGAAYVDVRMPSRAVAGGLTIADTPQPLAQQSASGAPGVIAADPGQASAAPPATAQSTPSAAAQAPPASVTPSTAANPRP
jgi:hypothetical protein